MTLIGNQDFENRVREICRYEDISLVGTCALLGGVCSQEIIKVLTEQFEPINNTFVYDGILGNGFTLNV
jgi:amyloid beta precursor protein binding protein 1